MTYPILVPQTSPYPEVDGFYKMPSLLLENLTLQPQLTQLLAMSMPPD
ncbi:MAG: hypothetical protein SFY66_28325 [Oculatellaceae cyanobacterium bins.114]|nr:hypothetical protein [Oculatellaceae cyanobacterium bins.114]